MGNIVSGRRVESRQGQRRDAEEHPRAPRPQRPGHQEPGHQGEAAHPRELQPLVTGVCRYHARAVCPRGHLCRLVHGNENEAALVDPESLDVQHNLNDRRDTLPVQPARCVPPLPRFLPQAQDEQPRVGLQRYRNVRARASRVAEPRRRLVPRDMEVHLFPEPPGYFLPRPRKPTGGPCWAWALGCCDMGKDCRLSHKKKGKPGDAQEATTDELLDAGGLYELGGAWVRFDAGALVSKVAFAADFSAVEIRNLPQGSTVAFVQELLEDVGMPTQGLDIDLFEQPVCKRYNAIVKAEDSMFAKTASSKLATYITYRGLQAFPVPPVLPASQSPQVDCRVVHCSWARPTRSAKLLFSTENAANELLKRAMDGTLMVLGSRVQASAEGSQDRRIVQLTGLLDTAEAPDVVAAIPEPDRPLKVLVKIADYACDLEYNASVVKTMLQRFGPVTRWVLPPSNDTQQFHAYSLFQEESMARNAAAALHEKLLPFGKATTLSVSIIASVKFKVLDRIYELIRPRIVAQQPVWEREQTYFHEGRPEGHFRCLKLEGEDHESVARARQFVDKAMSGDIVRLEAKDVRFCSLFAQDIPAGLLGNLEWACNVLIVPDLRRSLFRIYGNDELDQETVEAIARVLQKRVPESHAIDLNGVDFEWASTGGFKYLNSQLTQDAALIVSAEGPQLVITGPKADYNRAMAIIGRKMTASRRKDATSGMNCPACFCKPEEPVRMSCGHIYCGACFVGCCEAEMRASKEFQIRCPTDAARGGLCGKAFSLTELQESIPSSVFEQVLQKSFESYVSRRPAELAYCATPDCDQVYRILPPDSDHPGIFTCNKCLRSVCTICQDSHPARPCTGLGRDPNSVLDKKTKEQLGIKDCPRCSRMMEKSDGCDHMICSCGAHVCWVCLSSFDTSAECYHHLQRVHRGIYFH
ncbi:hypothetical protein A9Z42_0082120 [Trichoderma parareesei]|uniref:Uncharacterized protein n=1 Tax=Trichoderma parareesei TaxID=858221 RepID=A0A2H2ZKU1_TRIPA|nr:hypothetical protein A9Z42_0082120 [Trichoderma parareesei]